MEIDGLAAVVTGGASGLGAATARQLAAAGARVAVLDRDTKGAQAVAAETGGLGQECDVTDEDSMQAALDAARAAHGPARILVNCAGVNELGYTLTGKGPRGLESFKRQIDINLVGTYNAIRLAAWDMRGADPLGPEGERGVIVNVGSVAGLDGATGAAGYVASKAAVAGLTLALAREFSQHAIRVVTIAPGYFETSMTETLPPAWGEGWLGATPFPKRAGQAREFALLAEHIIQQPMLNGDVIRLDGAIRMPWF
jgi:NAD(P)-dependent dehydrogenase (short-subunit alcohol dehydrogenase family)